MALLHLMHESLFGYSQKKMFFKVHIVYIDEGPAVYNLSDSEHEDRLKFMINACTKYNFSYTIIPLEKVYDIKDIDTK